MSNRAVFIILSQAFEHDEGIRADVLKHGFKIQEQGLFTLTQDQARVFVEQKYLMPKPQDETPREETPRTSRSTDDESLQQDKVVENQIEYLTSGPIVVLVLEKDQAVAELQRLIRSEGDVESFDSKYKCSQAFHCSLNPWAVDSERDFFFRELSQRDSFAKGKSRGKKSDRVSIDTLLKFLFPPHLEHSNSTGRLYVFSLYGPLNEKSRLRSGERGLHVVTDRELDTMCSTIERQDILSVYADGALTQEEEEELMKQADHYLKVIPRFTKEDIHRMVKSLDRDPIDRTFSFHELQHLIFKIRQDRVEKMKAKIEIKVKDELQAKLKKHRTRRLKQGYEIAPKSMFLKDQGLSGSQNAVVVSKLLNTNSFKICNSESSNKPEITQNVRLLREEFDDGTNRPRWES